LRAVTTVEEMRDIDAAAQKQVPVEALIERAGRQVARRALQMIGGAYGRRVVVVAGKGHNGDDGRVAARRLAERGVRVSVVDAAGAPDRLPPCDLVIDAAYGTGFRGEYRAPMAPDAVPVLAVDIPSGLDGDTGEAGEEAVRADATVTFAAYKPGLLLGEGPDRAGRVEVVDIGLDTSSASAWLVDDSDVAALVPPRPREAHKWQTGVGVIAGSPGMLGAAQLCSRAAMRSGAGMVRLGVPGAGPADLPVGETVSRGLPAQDWAAEALEWTERCKAVVVGPGLGRDDATVAAARQLIARAPVPLVVDADGLFALGGSAANGLKGRSAPTVLTPHAGEFSGLAGGPPNADRLRSVRDLAERVGAVVLLKGSTTVVAEPEGPVLLSASGGPWLATAGTGDVLSGVIGALLARGVDALESAGLGAHIHGAASRRGRDQGLIAGDLPDLVGRTLGGLTAGRPASGAG